MALLTLLFGKPFKVQMGGIVLDVSLSENHQRTSVVTQSEIEDGSAIHDHVVLNPKQLIIEGFISDTPLAFNSIGVDKSFSGLVKSGVGLIAGTAVSGVTSALNNAFGGKNSTASNLAQVTAALGVASLAAKITGLPRKVEDIFAVLEELWVDREPFTVATKLHVYDNMIIASLSVPRNARIGRGIQFTATLQQITIVKSSTIDIADFRLAPDVLAAAANKAKLGNNSASTASDGNGENVSALHNLLIGD